MVLERRTVLGGAAAYLLQPVFAAPARIIDTHVHFYDPARPQGVPWPPKEQKVLYRTVLPREFIELTRPFGVTGAIIVEASPLVEDNQWILDLVANEPFILGLVGNLQPAKPPFAADLDRLRKNRRFLGIRSGALWGRDPATEMAKAEFIRDMKRLADAGLQLDAVGGPAILPRVVQLSDAVPELRIVIDHLPFDPPPEEGPRKEYQTALRELGRRPKVFAKVSSVLRRRDGKVSSELGDYKASLDELWEVFGPDRVIYGSNWPVSDLVAPYGSVFKVVQEYFTAKGAEAAEKYFFRNALAAYRPPAV